MEILGAVVGGSIASSGARSAARTQTASADKATELQKYMYDQTRTDAAPWRSTGVAGLNQLSMLLGLSPDAMSSLPPATLDALRAELLPQFTSAGTPAIPDTWQDATITGMQGGSPAIPGAVDEAGLQAAIQARMVPQGNALADNSQNPLFGSLMKPFTGANLESEPGYQFGLNQGVQAQDRSASARGSLYSGAQMKALTRFGNDYASTKYNDAFNRDQATKNQLFNMLSGVSGTGQVANNQINSAGQSYANQAGANMIGAGNARAAGGMASSNAWQNALNQGLSAWGRNTNQMQIPSMNQTLYGGGGFGTGNGFGNYDLGQYF